jgi:hypothetical protein
LLVQMVLITSNNKCNSEQHTTDRSQHVPNSFLICLALACVGMPAVCVER